MKVPNKLLSIRPIKKELFIRRIKINSKVKIMSGPHKSKETSVKKVLKDGYLYLNNILGLSSKKNSYYVKVHHSRVKVI